MTRRPKDIGTATTTGAIRYAFHPAGYVNAELRNQAGDHDKGDIVGIPRVVIECKGGNAAETAGDGLVQKWLEETEAERRNAGADIGLLVMKRAGYGPKRAGEWWCVMDIQDFTSLVIGSLARLVGTTYGTPVRMHLRTAVALLKAAGYGPR